MNEDCIRILKKVIVASTVSTVYEEAEKNHENISQDRRLDSRELIRVPTEYKSRAFPALKRARCAVTEKPYKSMFDVYVCLAVGKMTR